MAESEPTADDFSANNVFAMAGAKFGAGDNTRGPITGSGGGSGMNDGERISKLETHFEYIRKDLDELKSDQKKVLDAVRDLPTKSDLWNWKAQWTAICVAAIALIVGGIIGGLSWIKAETPQAAPPQSQSTTPTQSD